jgi:hypothetical protein
MLSKYANAVLLGLLALLVLRQRVIHWRWAAACN